MKSFDTLPISPTFVQARRGTLRKHWFDDEDVATKEIWLIGRLVTAPASVIDQDTPLAVARELLLERRVPAIAVVDATRSLRGLLTRTDLLRTLAKDPEATAGDAMSGFVFALPQDSTVEAAAALMAYEEVGQVVVVDAGGALVGIVSALDVARHVAMRAGLLAA
jgi:CBS domain-containing protein